MSAATPGWLVRKARSRAETGGSEAGGCIAVYGVEGEVEIAGCWWRGGVLMGSLWSTSPAGTGDDGGDHLGRGGPRAWVQAGSETPEHRQPLLPSPWLVHVVEFLDSGERRDRRLRVAVPG